MSQEQDNEFISWKILAWKTEFGLLTSPSMQHDWRPCTPMVSYCKLAHDLRELEYKDCHCGIYSRKEIDKELLKYDFDESTFGKERDVSVLAQLKNWGWVFEGSTGYRAQYSYPATILIRTKHQEHAPRIRELYQVPVVINDEAFGVVDKVVTKVDIRKINASLLTDAEQQKVILRLQRQQMYRDWYNRKKAVEKKLKHWKHLYGQAPYEIKLLSSKLAKLEQDGPYGQGG